MNQNILNEDVENIDESFFILDQMKQIRDLKGVVSLSSGRGSSEWMSLLLTALGTVSDQKLSQKEKQDFESIGELIQQLQQKELSGALQKVQQLEQKIRIHIFVLLLGLDTKQREAWLSLLESSNQARGGFVS